MKSVIEEIDKKLQSQELVSLAKAKSNIANSDSGFYWIYTQQSLKKFAECDPPTNPVHIDFSLMAKIHTGLESIITESDNDYWCIYNGKGNKLEQRISAGFTNTAGATGKLALLRCFAEDDFRIKYIICQNSSQKHGITESYSELQRDLERVWRLHYGWPFLCRT